MFECKFGILLNLVFDDYDIILLDVNLEYCCEFVWCVLLLWLYRVRVRRSTNVDEGVKLFRVFMMFLRMIVIVVSWKGVM